MARKRMRPVQIRLTYAEFSSLRKWAKNDGVSIAAVIRDMTRREEMRRTWAERDAMIEIENVHATERAA
jgi:hypothetical protein